MSDGTRPTLVKSGEVVSQEMKIVRAMDEYREALAKSAALNHPGAEDAFDAAVEKEFAAAEDLICQLLYYYQNSSLHIKALQVVAQSLGGQL